MPADPGTRGRRQLENLGDMDPAQAASKGYLGKALEWIGIGSMALPVLGKLSGGGAAALLSNPWGWAVAAGIGAGVGIYSLFNGVAENIDTDLQDFVSKVEEYLTDPDYRDPKLQQYLNRMLIESNNLARHVQALRQEQVSPEAYTQALGGIQSSMGAIGSALNLFTSSAEGILPATVYFHLLNEKFDNLESSVSEEVASLKEYAKRGAVAVNEGSGKEVHQEPSVDPTEEKVAPTPKRRVSDTTRVRSMQEFLLRVPSVFWQKAGFQGAEQLQVTGVMDPLTREALDTFAEYIATDLGLTNISGVRLEEEGDGRKLRKLWDIYSHTWKYF